jgi:adenine-specific DNA-methyltransferase
MSDYFRQFATRTNGFGSNSSWVVLSSLEENIKSKIEKIGKPLREWDIKIYRGILTGCNEAFVIDTDTKNQLIARSPKNVEIIRPILRGRNIKKYNAKIDDNWIINSHNGVRKSNIERIDVERDYPIIFEHLKGYEYELQTRLDKGSHWTNLRNCAYLDDLDKEKIIWMELTDRPNFYLDRDGYFINNTVFFMVGERLPYIISFLNSKLCEWYFTKVAATSGAGTRRWFKIYVEQICIPQKIDPKIENKLAELVNETQVRKINKLDTKNIEQEIDREIFRLFDLTDEEVNFILNSLL